MVYLKIKVNACILINTLIFLGNHLKIIYFTYITFFSYAPSNQILKLHIGYIGSVMYNLASLQSHLSKLFQQKMPLFIH
jgi:hypothetical protein